MNRCSYCGKRYADNVMICPADGEPVFGIYGVKERVALRPMFNARLVSSFSSSGIYQIDVRTGDLIFIRLEGGVLFTFLTAIIPLLGPLGAIVGFTMRSFYERASHELRQKLAAHDPEELLREDGKHFKIHLSEIQEAVFNLRLFGKLAVSQSDGWRFPSNREKK